MINEVFIIFLIIACFACNTEIIENAESDNKDTGKEMVFDKIKGQFEKRNL